MKILISNRKATLQTKDTIVTDNNDYVVEFVFDEEWANTGVKTAVIVRQDGTEYEPKILDRNNCITLPNITGTSCVYIGVTAGNIRTSTPARVMIEKSILAVGGKDVIPEPEPSVYAQIIAKINDAIDRANSATTKANNAQTTADKALAKANSIVVPTIDHLATKSEVNTLSNQVVKTVDGIAPVNGNVNVPKQDLTPYAIKSDVYTKEQVDTAINNIPSPDLTAYAKKADVYTKNDVYSKAEVNAKIADIDVTENIQPLVYRVTAVENNKADKSELASINTSISNLATKGDVKALDTKTTNAINTATSSLSTSIANASRESKQYTDSVMSGAESKLTQYVNAAKGHSTTAVQNADRAVQAKRDALNAQTGAETFKNEAVRAANEAKLHEDHAKEYAESMSGTVEALVSDIQTLNSTKADKSDTYTKSEVNKKIADVDVSAQIKPIDDRLKSVEENKADKTSTYTKTEVDSKIADATPEDYDELKQEVSEIKGDFNQFATNTNKAISNINETVGDEPASEEMSEDVIVALQNMTPLLSNMVSLLLNLPQEDSANALITEMKKRTDVLALILNNMEV